MYCVNVSLVNVNVFTFTRNKKCIVKQIYLEFYFVNLVQQLYKIELTCEFLHK